MRIYLATTLLAISLIGCSGQDGSSESLVSPTPLTSSVPADAPAPPQTLEPVNPEPEPGVRILGHQKGCISLRDLDPELGVGVKAGKTPVRIRAVNFYSPDPGCAVYEFGEHPLTRNGPDTYLPGTSGTTYFTLDNNPNQCGHQQVDVQADMGDGRGWRNIEWFFIDSGRQGYMLPSGVVTCTPPIPTPPVPQVVSCFTPGAFLATTVEVVPGGYRFGYQTGAVAVEGVRLAVYEHTIPGQKHPQDRTHMVSQTFPPHTTGFQILPTRRSCSTQGDLICGDAPLVYTKENAADVDARVMGDRYKGYDYTEPCQ